jgi:GYF domain 2
MGQRIADSLTARDTSAGSAPAPGASAPAPAPGAPAAGPPPLPQAAQWFVGVGGVQQGPYDPAALSGLVGAGTLTRETLVWKDGMSGWLPAAQVPEVGGLFGAVPPPLPPQG